MPLILNLLLLVCLFALTLVMAGPLYRRMMREEDWYRSLLLELYMPHVTPRSITVSAVICGIVGAMMGVLLLNSSFAAAAFAVVSYNIPRLYLGYLRKTRRKRLNSQLVDGILTISNGVAAGLNLNAALKLVEQNAPAPLSQEIGYLLREYEYGMPLEAAMERAAERVQLPNYRLLFLALRTGMERGGKLSDTLQNIAESLREISRLEEKVETMTAQGRASARLMSLMPLVVVGILYMIDPTAVGLLFTTVSGRILLAIAGGVLLAGWTWMQRIVSVDV